MDMSGTLEVAPTAVDQADWRPDLLVKKSGLICLTVKQRKFVKEWKEHETHGAGYDMWQDAGLAK